MAHSKIGWKTAAALVISNMIGTGVFTSLGYQISDLKNTTSILLLWSIGGLLALIGAFIYSELASKFKQSGGDYIYLSRTFHPVFGYLSSWISLFVGFSAPISLAALAMGKYLNVVFGFDLGKEFAIAMILIVAVFQSFSLNLSSKFQNIFTILKVVFIVVLIVLGFYFAPAVEPNAVVFDSTWKNELLLPAFATSLVYVTFAYTGWNSASYIVEEIEQPKQNLPKALFIGVIFVTISYVLLNYVFLKHASAGTLAGQENVANISFGNLLGNNVKWVSCFIALQLIATISGYLWIGSRLTQATARENKLWNFMAKENKNRIPVRAIWVHTAISILLIFSGDFEVIFTYTSFVLQILATLAVCTAFFIKQDQLTIIKSKFFYVLPAIFLAFSLYICYFVLMQKPKESLFGLGIIALGIVLFYFDKRIEKKD